MQANEGTTDRIIRAGIAIVAAVLAIVVGPGSIGGIVLWIVAAIMAVTALVGMCPICRLLGLSTRPHPGG